MHPEKKTESSAPVPDEATDPPTRSKSKSKEKRGKSDKGPRSLEASQADLSHASGAGKKKRKSSEPQADILPDPPTKLKSKEKRKRSDQGPRSLEASQTQLSDASGVRKKKRKSSAPPQPDMPSHSPSMLKSKEKHKMSDQGPLLTSEAPMPAESSAPPQPDMPSDLPSRSKSKEKRKKSDQEPHALEASQSDVSNASAVRKKRKSSAPPQPDMPSHLPSMSKSKEKRKKSDQGPRSLEASQVDVSDASSVRKKRKSSRPPQPHMPSEPPTRSKSKDKRSKPDEPPMPAEASHGVDTREAQSVGIVPEQQPVPDAATRSMLFLGAQTSTAAPVAYMGLPSEGNAAEPSRSPPDSLDCWLVVVSSCFCIFFSMALMKSESALYVGVLEMFNVTRQSASWPLTVSITLSQLAGPVYGVLGTWLSDRILLLMGAFCCSVPVMISSFTHEIWQITITYGVFSGLGLACAEVMPFAVVSRHFQRYRGAAVGVLFIVTALSGFVWPLVIVALRTGLGFRTALLVVGALELNMFFGGLFVDRVELQATTPAEGAGSVDHKPGPNGEVPRGTQRLSPGEKLMRNLVSLATVPFFHVATSRAISVFGIQTFLLTAEDFGRDNGLEEFEATSLVSAFAAGDMVARIGTGIVLDYKLLSGPYLMLWTFAANTASMFVLGWVMNYWLMIGSCFVSGICGGSRIFTANIMVAQFFEDRVLQLGLGVMNFVAGVAIFARPPIVGYSKDVLGRYAPLYIGIGVSYGLFMASWVVSCLWKRHETPQGDSPVKKVAGGVERAKPS